MIKEKEVEQFYTKISKQYYKLHNKRFCDELLEFFINKYLPKKKLKILDAGGGIGRFAIPLAKKKHEVILSDISQGMLDNAKRIATKQNVRLTYVKESVIHLKHDNNSFDIVLVMNAILDYCGDYKKALKEIYRVLKPNGILIGSVNNRFIYVASHELKEGDLNLFKRSMKTGDRYIIWVGKSGHWTHEFTLKELKKSLKKQKLSIVCILGIFNLLDKYADISNFKKNKLKKLFNLQIEYAQKDEYINNSSDFFFVAKKKPVLSNK